MQRGFACAAAEKVFLWGNLIKTGMAQLSAAPFLFCAGASDSKVQPDENSPNALFFVQQRGKQALCIQKACKSVL